MHYIVEPGEFDIMLGNSSENYKAETLVVSK